jgi:hypothetical protein
MDPDGNATISGDLTVDGQINILGGIQYSEFFGGLGWYENLMATSEGSVIQNSSHFSAMDYVEINKSAPNGSLTAERAHATGGGLWFRPAVQLEDMTSYTMSFWAKLISGNGDFHIALGGGTESDLLTATSTWERFEYTEDSAFNDFISILKLTSAGVMDFWGFQVNTGGGVFPYCRTKGNVTERNYGSWVNGYSGEFTEYSDGVADFAIGVTDGEFVISDQPIGIASANHVLRIDSSENVQLGKNNSTLDPLATVTINVDSSNHGADTYPDGLWIHNRSDGDAAITLSSGNKARWTMFHDQSDNGAFKLWHEAAGEALSVSEDCDTTIKCLRVSGNLTLLNPDIPSSASDTGTKGDISSDENWIYSCVATDTWKRSPLTTW